MTPQRQGIRPKRVLDREERQSKKNLVGDGRLLVEGDFCGYPSAALPSVAHLILHCYLLQSVSLKLWGSCWPQRFRWDCFTTVYRLLQTSFPLPNLNDYRSKMSFKTPFEPDSPSTPDKSRSFLSNVSTTPAGPPPSSASFIPRAAPPKFGNSPQSLFGKSGIENDSIFGSSIGSDHFMPPRKKDPAPAKSLAPSQSLFSTTNGSRFNESTSFGQSNSFTSSWMSEGQEEEMPEEEYEDEWEDENTTEGDMDVDKTKKSGHGLSFMDSTLSREPPRPTTALGHRKSIYSNPTNAKRPKLDERWANQSPLRKTALPPKKDSVMPSIVRNFASRSSFAPVDEPSDMILRTEDEVLRLYDEARQAEEQGKDFYVSLSEVSSTLSSTWKSCAERKGFAGAGFGVGRGEQAPNDIKASFLGSLLLQLHHPPINPPKTASPPGAFGRFAPQSLILAGTEESTFTPVPKLLLDWLNTNHVSQSADIRTLDEAGPNPTASPNFWETITAAVLRGRLGEASTVLRSADFNYARSALEDGLPQSGYRGVQLQNIQKCVNKAVQILDSCPGVQHEDWDVKGTEWSMYRNRVVTAVTELEEFAEGDESSPEPPVAENRFQAINFGLKQTTGDQGFSFTKSARMAESRVPWTIYQNLRTIYRVILGDPGAIMSLSQDWIEAVIGLTAWWDGMDDSSPEDAYLRRLDLAFNSATNDPSTNFRVNTLSGLEVGLASVFEGNVDGVLRLLQTWSLCIASAVAEVASAGGWMDAADGARKLPGLSENDLMVLSYGQDGTNAATPVRRDDVLNAYASGLFERKSIQNDIGVRDGWELALEVLSRLEDNEKMQKTTSELLGKLPLDTAEQMDKVVLLCSELGLESEGRRVSEVSVPVTIVATDT